MWRATRIPGATRVQARDDGLPNAHTYRDWVVKALNDDLPYDQFITEQIAADHSQAPGKPVGALAALGFLTVNDSFVGDGALHSRMTALMSSHAD